MGVATVWQTGRPRAGRRFEPTHERELHADAVNATASLARASERALVISEMVGPIGIPDMTALAGSPEQLDKRLALGVPEIINQLDASIVAAASAIRAHSLAQLAARLGWTIETLDRRVPGLLKSGALQAVSHGFVRPKEIRPLGRVYAVEAKVRDWNAALQQARSYAVWADSYVLVMGPLGPRPFKSLFAEVVSDRAGLMVDGRWVRRPAVRRLSPGKRLWSAEHFVAGIRESGYQPSVAP